VAAYVDELRDDTHGMILALAMATAIWGHVFPDGMQAECYCDYINQVEDI
jgi:hypothetical protein|tara:strand:- start:34 stop:183 length:150 start_codon:yes stop_codon:yes gene_type:complete